jgi:hypothetical protein
MLTTRPLNVAKCSSNWACYYFLFEKMDVKHFVQCHVFDQSPHGRRHNDKYPVNIHINQPTRCIDLSDLLLIVLLVVVGPAGPTTTNNTATTTFQR